MLYVRTTSDRLHRSEIYGLSFIHKTITTPLAPTNITVNVSRSKRRKLKIEKKLSYFTRVSLMLNPSVVFFFFGVQPRRVFSMFLYSFNYNARSCMHKQRFHHNKIWKSQRKKTTRDLKLSLLNTKHVVQCSNV